MKNSREARPAEEEEEEKKKTSKRPLVADTCRTSSIDLRRSFKG